MIKAIIIDDEPDCVRLLALQLKMARTEVEVVAECLSAEEGLKAIRSWDPDLVFLDIEMPRMNGFQMLESIGDVRFSVIFVTAYDRFAVRAFRFSALDYLLKPVDTRELQKAVNKATRSGTGPRQIDFLKQQIQMPHVAAKKIALPYQNGLVFVELESILYCESDNNYTRFVTRTGEKYLVSKTLREIQDALDGRGFIRVHRQFLVNTEHIARYVRGEGNYLVMSDNKSIPIAKSHKDDLMERFGRI